ncbi:Protein kinase C iota type [Heterocephalus glaber]|uniref:Protein kinase C iota type n=1 Tax=Heterocephalus glaber TaxID=10181 RepID=G5ATW2_HETGA|nr:Protein kinase C iota type [Heterocephalus glaber]
MTVTDTPGTVSPGVTTSDLLKSIYPSEVPLSPNTNDTETGKRMGQVSPGPETPSSSGKASPGPGIENLESQSPGGETKVTATGPQETLKSLVYIHPDLASTVGNNFTKSHAGFWPVWSLQAVGPLLFFEPCLPISLGSQLIYVPFFPGTSITHTSTQSALTLGRDIMTRYLEDSIPFEGLCDKDPDVWCLDNKQLFTTHGVEKEGDPYTVSPQLELEEAIRLSELKKDSELLIHSSLCIPAHPKVPCPGEEKFIHHRAAGCWRKLYYVNGQTFQAKCFSRGFADIQEHLFFQNVDWDMMEQKQVVPPFKPNISEVFSLNNFDPEFTNEPVQLNPDDNDVMRELDGYEFAGFEYINYLTMYEEGV